MKAKRLKAVNDLSEIPQFTSEAEEHEFWSTHSVGDKLWDQAEPFGPDELPPPRPETKPVVIRLDEPTLARAKALAKRRRRRVEAVLAELVTEQLATASG